jgi:uncharacterized protein YcgL (UPF0745 family)
MGRSESSIHDIHIKNTTRFSTPPAGRRVVWSKDIIRTKQEKEWHDCLVHNLPVLAKGAFLFGLDILFILSRKRSGTMTALCTAYQSSRKARSCLFGRVVRSRHPMHTLEKEWHDDCLVHNLAISPRERRVVRSRHTIIHTKLEKEWHDCLAVHNLSVLAKGAVFGLDILFMLSLKRSGMMTALCTTYQSSRKAHGCLDDHGWGLVLEDRISLQVHVRVYNHDSTQKQPSEYN